MRVVMIPKIKRVVANALFPFFFSFLKYTKSRIARIIDEAMLILANSGTPSAHKIKPVIFSKT